MAGKAFLSKEFLPFLRRGDRVRVMTGPTPQTIATRLLALALPEFLKVTGHLELLRPACRPYEGDDVIGKTISGLKRCERTSFPCDSGFTREVTLGADAGAQFRCELRRIADRPRSHSVIQHELICMARSRAVAAFTPHATFEKRNGLVTILGPSDVLKTTRMAIETVRLQGAGAVNALGFLVSGRDVPFCRRRIIGNGCLKEKTILGKSVTPPDRSEADVIIEPALAA